MSLISGFSPTHAMPQPVTTGAQGVSATRQAPTAAGLASGMTGPVPAEVGQRLGAPSVANPLKPRLPDPMGQLASVQASATTGQVKLPDVLTTVGIILFGDMKDLLPPSSVIAHAPSPVASAPTTNQIADALTKLAFLWKH